MKHQIHRRSFLKHAAVVGGSLMTADTLLRKPLVAADSSKPALSSVQPSEAQKACHGRVVEPRLDPVFTKPDGQRVYLPLQFETTISPDWFWKKQNELVHTSVGTIADWYRRAQAAKANLLLNVGPDRDGLIPEYNRHFLRRTAMELGLA